MLASGATAIAASAGAGAIGCGCGADGGGDELHPSNASASAVRQVIIEMARYAPPPPLTTGAALDDAPSDDRTARTGRPPAAIGGLLGADVRVARLDHRIGLAA